MKTAAKLQASVTNQELTLLVKPDVTRQCSHFCPFAYKK